MNNDLERIFEGFHCVTRSSDAAWVTIVYATRNPNGWCKLTARKGSVLEPTDRGQFFHAFTYAKSIAEEMGRTMENISLFSASFDPIYSSVKSIFVEFDDGNFTARDIEPLLSSKHIQYTTH